MLEPATTMTPCPGKCQELDFESPCSACPNKSLNFLHQVQALCKEKNSLLILDEMITGFRWALEGASYYFGVKPDLMTFGKGMANGFSVAAVTGRREVMEVGAIDKPGKERTFLLSTTHGGEMCGLGAFIETVKIYQEENVCRELWNFGGKLKVEVSRIADELGLTDYFQIIGPSICLNYITRDRAGDVSLGFRTLFNQEMIRHGVLMPWISPSLAHGNSALDETLVALRESLFIYREALDVGYEDYLEGPEILPIFRKNN